MLSKSKIKLINSLNLGKFRKRHGLFIAEGSINVLDFLKSDIKVEALYATREWIEGNIQYLSKIDITEVNAKELKKISNLKNPSEVLAVFKIPGNVAPNLHEVKETILMIDDMRDPGNLGTIIRTADWFGIQHIICSPDSVDAYNPKVVQASMGSLARVQIHYQNLEKVIKSKPDYLNVFGAVLDGDNIADVAKPNHAIILIGSEAHGISKKLIPLIDKKITIPNTPSPDGSSAESLNASIATAIICYEFRK